MPNTGPSFIHVAVGVIKRADGSILIAKRRDDAHQGGLWEFPGGKVEADESVQSALRRELKEELAIEIQHSVPLIQIRHHYSDKSVLLDVWEVDRYTDSPTGNEGQPLEWVSVEQLEIGSDGPYPLPAANAAIIKALRLPQAMMITGEFDDQEDFLGRLKRALERGIRLVQLRPSASMDTLSKAAARELLEQACVLCSAYNATLVMNAAMNISSAAANGIHLPASELMASLNRPIGPQQLLGVSCHNAEELQKAAELNADYILLSPVKPTASHPHAEVLGWDQFQSLVQAANTPVFALGGMQQKDTAQARAMGAQGIAAISAFWDI